MFRLSVRRASPFLTTLAALLAATPAFAADKPTYNRDIRPILSENCFACHGPDKAARKADLRLDIREEALKAGAFVPGKPDESPLVERIFTTVPSKIMPTPKSHKKLTATQKETLRRWVADGAEYQAHWAFIPPKPPATPVVKNQLWARNPLDMFLLAEMEKRGLTPAPEADRRTLARRVCLDLTGLPPTAAAVDAFVADKRSDAYERYVDTLLASPFWGEHRGRYWLDAARYADTHGIHFDNFREMWTYRDWVINAFNRNQPFDRFAIEQIAGDLLPGRTLDQQIASGFNRCNITTNEGGAISEEYLVLYTRDRTETMSQVFMGLTTGCAVCHDHKLDPITQREFYQLASFFNNTTQSAMDGNIKDTPPIITVPRPEDRSRWVTLISQAQEAKRRVEARKAGAAGDFAAWMKTAKPEQVGGKVPTEGLVFQAPLAEGNGNKTEVKVAGKARQVTLTGRPKWIPGQLGSKATDFGSSTNLTLADVGDFERDKPFTVSAWVRLPAAGTGAIVARMDDGADFRGWDLWVENGKVGMHIINAWPTDALKVVAGSPLKPNTWTHVLASYDGSSKAAGVSIYVDGVLQTARETQADALRNTIRTKVPLKFAQRNKLSRINGLGVQDLRFYSRALNAAEVSGLGKGGRLSELVSRIGKLTPAERIELFDWWLTTNDAEYKKLSKAADDLGREETSLKSRGTVAHVTNERADMPMAHILYRGDYDKRRDAVKPNTPKVLPAMADALPRNRLGLAEWLVTPGHPLTSRVTVNRFWQEVFGTGIVRTAGDFGTAGELPSNPELLDYLALEFERTWDMKAFFRMLVTSAAYRQSALTTPEKREKDPFNVLLSRGPRFRLDGEAIRDYALASSGLLVPTFGGPSVKPYQPEGVWEAVAMIGSNTRDYRADAGDSLYRRSLYTFWKRSAPPASMDIFNAPSREVCVVRRDRTNTPLQALVTLNDVQFVEAARVLAEKTIKEGGTSADRLTFLAKTLLGRSLNGEEGKVVGGMLQELLAHYRNQPEEAKKLLAVGAKSADAKLDPAEVAAWTMLANSLMNLDEILSK